MSEVTALGALAERGTAGRAPLRGVRLPGARPAAPRASCSDPIAAYFYLRERLGAARVAPLPRAGVGASGGPRSVSGRGPAPFAPFWHYHEFAVADLRPHGALGRRGLDRAPARPQRRARQLFAARARAAAARSCSAPTSAASTCRASSPKSTGSCVNVVMFTAHAERINRVLRAARPEEPDARGAARARLGPAPSFAIKALPRARRVRRRSSPTACRAGATRDAGRSIDFLGRAVAVPALAVPAARACSGAPRYLVALRAARAERATTPRVRRIFDGGTRCRAHEREKARARARARLGARARGHLPAASLPVVQLLRLAGRPRCGA